MTLKINIPRLYHTDIFPKPKEPVVKTKHYPLHLIGEALVQSINLAFHTALIALGISSTPMADAVVDGLETLVDFTEAAEIHEHAENVIDWSKRKVKVKSEKQRQKLEISKGAIGSVHAAGHVVELVERFGNFARLSHALDFIAFLPFHSFLSILEIGVSSLSIAIDANKIKRIHKSIVKEKDKKQQWSGKIDVQFAKEKIGRIQTKMDDLKLQIKEIETLAKKSFEKLQPTQKIPFFKRLSVKAKFKAHDKTCNLLQDRVTAYNDLAAKKLSWNHIHAKLEKNDFSTDEKKALEDLKNKKIEKHDAKLLSLKKSKENKVLTIMEHALLITLAVAAIVLTALALASLPIPTIAIGVIGVSAALVSLTALAHKYLHKPKKIPGVEIPKEFKACLL